ncbi:hypothetical protein H4R24_002787 [Coemansia sp. RSA 988]|nr:hypothetical protein H4R24_002787 [Coemansia sp. RSA 988]
MRSPIDDDIGEYGSVISHTPGPRDGVNANGEFPSQLDPVVIDNLRPTSEGLLAHFHDSDLTPVSDTLTDSEDKQAIVTHTVLDDSPQHEKQALGEKEDVKNDVGDGEAEDDSPYEIVRHSVSNKDTPDMYSLTFRVWLLGIIFTGVLSFVNQFFFYRQNQLSLGGSVVQLLAFPAGYILSHVLPKRKFSTFGWTWSLNPGPFNIKEHVLISIFATASSGSPYAIDVVTIKKIWYQSDLGFVASLLFILTSQIMGYSFAGLTRKFLVYPAAMIWPATLISVTLFRTFHEIQDFGGKMSRTKMFWICFIGSFVWYFVPNFLIPALTYIAVLCYIAPNNIIANQLGDSYNGLGMLNFTLDWSTISSNMGSPIAYPWVMACNLFAGFVIVMWIITPIGYYSNAWNSGNMPIYTAHLYQANGSAYDIHAIMTPDQHLDEAKYAEYGPVRMTFQFAISYGIGFAAIITLLVYIVLHYGKEIYQRVRQSRRMEEDIHMKLMSHYEEVPHWWYIVLFVITFTTSIVICEVYHMMPWYWVIISTVVPLVFTIPVGIIQAISNQQPGLNVITEFIIGYGLPGNPIANVTFKVYGYITMTQALNLVSDLKLGHYMKIPPRHMFIVQLAGTIFASFIELGVAYWLMNTVENICTPEGYPFTCISANTFYSASVLWGLIGPSKLFGSSSPYHPVLYLFFVGALLPIPVWYLQRRYPTSAWRYINIPVAISIAGAMPPMPTASIVNWFIGCFVFNYIIHKYHNTWWQRYAFSLSAGLDSGVAISGILQFGMLTKAKMPQWWGADANHCKLAPTGGFMNRPT